MTTLGRAGAVTALGAATLVLALHRGGAPAAVSPRRAAARAEAVVPPLGVVWGKLRGWERRQNSWWLVWQPAHGAWVVTAWVPDGAAEVRATLAAAPWLPGARLSGEAARLLTEAGPEEVGVPTELVGRRDWQFGESALVGAVRTHRPGPSRRQQGLDPWAAVLVGLILAGAVARTVLPTLPSRGWRRATLAAGAALLASMPTLAPLVWSAYRPGVRPWVAGVSLMASGVVVLVGIAVAVYRFPVLTGDAPPWWVAAGALAGGTLLSWVAPLPWAAELAGTALPVPAVPAVAVLLGWLSCLAADGLRELTRRAGRAMRLAVAGLAAGAVAAPATAAPLVVAACVGASSSRAAGAWVTLAMTWGWVATSLLAGCAWPGAVRLAFGLALAGWALVAAQAVAAGHEPAGLPATRG